MNDLQILSIDAVMSAMADYASAQSDHDVARDKYQGYSWGYHGHSYIHAVDSAKEHAESVLEQYIQACVEKALAKINTKSP
jgi:hypothetical protein